VHDDEGSTEAKLNYNHISNAWNIQRGFQDTHRIPKSNCSKENLTMENEIIWVTGASSGIGKELALKIARSGKNVAVSARNAEMLEKLKESAKDGKDLIKIFPCDIASLQSVTDTEKKISKEFNIAALFNNAGVTSFKPAADDTIEEIQKIINTNLLGAIYTIKSVLPAMIKANRGVIVNTVSVVAKKIFTASSAYSASKSGLLAYTDVLREEVRKNNIKILNVLPGATKTPIWPNSALEKFSERMMTPADVASVIMNLYGEDGTAVPEEITLRPLKGDL
jgi:short-subunit dehydrogenase